MHNMNYGLGYLKYLKFRRDQLQRQQNAIPKPLPLEQRIKVWFNDLSDEDKRRAWTMREFRSIFGDTPQKIGAALFGMGWTRKRMWRDDRPTARYWLKE